MNNLDDWAFSFSGCDGGNPGADIWLCGIEWGYENATDEERKNYYENELPREIENGECKLNTNYNFFTDESMNYPFNLAFSKLYSAIQGIDFIDCKLHHKNIIRGQSPLKYEHNAMAAYDWIKRGQKRKVKTNSGRQ